MSLVKLSKYKEYLKITDSALDAQITDLQSAVEKRVKEYLHRDIESTTYTAELYNGSGKSELVMRQFPVTSVTSVAVYDGYYNNAEVWTTLVLGTDYTRKTIPLEAYSFILDDYTFEKGNLNYKITYVAGYASTAIPDDIQLACKELLKIAWDNSPLNQNRLGFLSVSDSAGSANENLSLDSDIETKILKKIECHRAINV